LFQQYPLCPGCAAGTGGILNFFPAVVCSRRLCSDSRQLTTIVTVISSEL